MTAVPLAPHRSPSAGFDRPYEMLAACHERVARMLALLEKLHEHLQQHGADEPARQTARDVMRYFDIAAPLHHEDEEKHVFPRLRAQGQAALADRLHAEHEAMVPAWAAVRASLEAVAQGRVPALPAAGWAGFVALYRRHLADEDGSAYPVARAATAAADERAMGNEMSARRGL